jgi:hypothetical protein
MPNLSEPMSLGVGSAKMRPVHACRITGQVLPSKNSPTRHWQDRVSFA